MSLLRDINNQCDSKVTSSIVIFVSILIIAIISGLRKPVMIDMITDYTVQLKVFSSAVCIYGSIKLSQWDTEFDELKYKILKFIGICLLTVIPIYLAVSITMEYLSLLIESNSRSYSLE